MYIFMHLQRTGENGMERLQIAAQTYTVREYTKTEAGIASSLEKIAKIGYDSVQVSGFGPCRAEFLRDELLKNGLRAVASHTPYERIVGDTEKVISEHKIAGIPVVGLGYRKLAAVAQTEQFLRELLPAARKIRDAGLRFAYHNHQWEFVRMENGETAMRYLLEHTKPEEFGLIADLYWLQYAGVSPERFLRENGERIPLVHFKDMRVDPASGEPRFAEIFEGNMDYSSYARAAAETGIPCAAVEQDECYGVSPFEALRISRENIRKKLHL